MAPSKSFIESMIESWNRLTYSFTNAVPSGVYEAERDLLLSNAYHFSKIENGVRTGHPSTIVPSLDQKAEFIKDLMKTSEILYDSTDLIPLREFKERCDPSGLMGKEVVYGDKDELFLRVMLNDPIIPMICEDKPYLFGKMALDQNRLLAAHLNAIATSLTDSNYGRLYRTMESLSAYASSDK